MHEGRLSSRCDVFFDYWSAPRATPPIAVKSAGCCATTARQLVVAQVTTASVRISDGFNCRCSDPKAILSTAAASLPPCRVLASLDCGTSSGLARPYSAVCRRIPSTSPDAWPRSTRRRRISRCDEHVRHFCIAIWTRRGRHGGFRPVRLFFLPTFVHRPDVRCRPSAGTAL